MKLPKGSLPLITLDQKIEDLLREKIQRGDQGTYLALEPSLAQKILRSHPSDPGPTGALEFSSRSSFVRPLSAGI